MNSRIIKYIFLVGIAIVLYSCGAEATSTETEVKSVINDEFISNIETEKVVYRGQMQELTLSGEVVCEPNSVIYYTPLISGVVERTYFSLGDRVKKGQTMLDIRSSELSSLQSEFVIAKQNLQSVEAMYKDNLIPERDLIEARSKFEKLQADLSLYGANKGGGIFAIESPKSGYVIEKNAFTGSPIATGDVPLFTIADLSTVCVVANVYANSLQSVKENMAVEITTLAYPDEVLSAKIDAISQVFDPEERVLKARIIIENKDLKFKPGMSVVVKLKEEKQHDYLSISSDALIFDDNKYFVVIESERGKFEIREVQQQGFYKNISYICSGLNENENVVVKNHLLIYSELRGI